MIVSYRILDGREATPRTSAEVPCPRRGLQHHGGHADRQQDSPLVAEQVCVGREGVVRKCSTCSRLIRFRRERPGGPVVGHVIPEPEERDLLARSASGDRRVARGRAPKAAPPSASRFDDLLERGAPLPDADVPYLTF